MELTDLIPGVIGSFVGVMGWLLVGLYIQRRQFIRQARSAARAVHFEVDVNVATIAVARDHGLYTDLSRSAFERLLPELSSLMSAQDMKRVADAYMTHAGYRQLAPRDDLPDQVRRSALEAFVAAHERALDALSRVAFTPDERAALAGTIAPDGGPRSPQDVDGASR